MRVGATVLFLDGFCYQSYAWKQMRPLGKLQGILDSLESYQCDEISIIRPIREYDTKDTFEKDINILRNINSMTPLSFGGGLRSIEQIDLLHNLPIERLIFSSAFIKQDRTLIEYSRKLFGHQAIQCLLPFSINGEVIQIFNSEDNKYINFDELNINFIDEYSNEIILFDTKNEGVENTFNKYSYEYIGIDNKKLVISGGIGKETIKWAKKNGIASVLIENRVLHKEYSIKEYKNV
jgi:phosphoribosylformimino-5-aminoimidazole carboxamide ribonucleotide (ProFAR) isomerase